MLDDPKRTHRLVKSPKINARYLADYMAASERKKRTIVRDCRYRPIARIIQHDLAKDALTRFFVVEGWPSAKLSEEAERLRTMMADTPFDRELLDNNADYIDAFVAAIPALQMPHAERGSAEGLPPLAIHGVRINPDIRFTLRRTTKTNKLKGGLVTFRYAKGKALNPEVGLWQSSFLFGYRMHMDDGKECAPEHKLCVTIDAFAGKAHEAPSDALSRFRNMEAACQTIAERWDSIEPPSGAVFD